MVVKLPKGYRALKPVHPNAGIAAEYRRRLDDLIADMRDSYDYWITATYRANQSEIALDKMPDTGSPARVTAVQSEIGSRNVVWLAYVNGRPLMARNGALRTFRSRDAAETGGLRSTGLNMVLTDPVRLGDRFDAVTLANLPVVLSPAQNLQETIDKLGARWEARFDETAPKLAQWFAQTAGKRSEDGLKKILRDGGMTVRFEMTAPMRNILNATVAENTGLIKSIGSQYHSEVQGMVMRSVAAGRDVGMLTRDLRERYGITRRRAAFIALDQNNKSTSAFVRVRQVGLGLQAIWLHSHAGKKPRPTHLGNTGKPYDPALGWFDPDPKVRRRIWPGELPRCRCVSRSLVKGFS
jgi:hypothetical protein